MPRRKAQVNLTDTRRLVRAFKLEGVDFRATQQPGGAVVFESTTTDPKEDSAEAETSENLRKLL